MADRLSPTEEQILMGAGLRPEDHAALRAQVQFMPDAQGNLQVAPVNTNAGNMIGIACMVIVPVAAFKSGSSRILTTDAGRAIAALCPIFTGRLIGRRDALANPPEERETRKINCEMESVLLSGVEQGGVAAYLRSLLVAESVREGRIGLAEGALILNTSQVELARWLMTRGITPPPLEDGATLTGEAEQQAAQGVMKEGAVPEAVPDLIASVLAGRRT